MPDELPGQMPDELPGPTHRTVRERWLAAVAYLGPGCLITMFARDRTPFLTWHAQQGFALFFLEAAVVALLVILDNTIGRIPILGLVVIILVQLAAFVVFLVLSLLGFVKALAGETFRIPVLDDYAERVPLHDN